MNFKKAKGILMVEEARVEVCGATWCSWKHVKTYKVIDG
jgi:hypothetical protein